MFRLVPKARVDDDDSTDRWSVPSTYQHFNPAGRPKSKLGRRRIIKQNDEKVENDQLGSASKPKQLLFPAKNADWFKDDSGFATSGSTPHSTDRFGSKYTSSADFFTPSSRLGQENVFDKFAHPATPCRAKAEPLKEINCPNVIEKPVIESGDKNSNGAILQKQLNSSFISEETMPMVSLETQQTANKIVNETTSDFSNDSSFMTAYDIRTEPPSNKTVYDPEFFKTPGKNLAEIRIDESPFNPLENFLEECLDVVDNATKTPLRKNVNSGNYCETTADNGTCGSEWDQSVGEKPNISERTCPLAVPLDSSYAREPQPEVKINNSITDHFQGSKFRDDNFKYPAFNHFRTPHPFAQSSNEAIAEPMTNVSVRNEEITHVTYPQPSKNTHQPKSTFTSQFSLSKPDPSSNDLRALSLANPSRHWGSGAIGVDSYGSNPVHFSGQVSCSSRPASGMSANPRQTPAVDGAVEGRRPPHLDPSHSTNRSELPLDAASHSRISQGSNLAGSTSEKTVLPLKPASCASILPMVSTQENSNHEDAITVVAQGSEIPRQAPVNACLRPAAPAISAVIIPQPQNVINIKGIPYTVLSLLGKGGSSQVYQALGPQSSRLMAIKCVDLGSAGKAMAADYLNEIALLLKLQGCPSVIKMLDHEYVEESQMLYVVLEKGDIDFSKLIKNVTETKEISMPMIIYYWSEMLNAVHEIHSRGIIHSDLKPANFLLVEGRLKLIDFGIASSLEGDTTSVMKDNQAGTYNYMSPEAITGPKITRKSDVWSMGCILYNLLYRRTPFSHFNQRWTKLTAIADPKLPVEFPKLPHHTPPSLRLALRWCLNKNPANRPTVEELVKLSELAPQAESGLGKEIDGMMCKYFQTVLPNLKNINEDEDIV